MVKAGASLPAAIRVILAHFPVGWKGAELNAFRSTVESRAAREGQGIFDLFGTGFSINIWESSACSSGFVLDDELDYSVTYQNKHIFCK